MEAKDLSPVNYTFSVVTSILSSLASHVPGIAQLVDAFNEFEKTVQYNNIVDVLQNHAEQIKKLNDSLNKVYTESPYYVRDILDTMQKAKDELNSEKRRAYASYLTACCHIENKGNINKQIFLDYLGRLDYLDIFILRCLTSHFNGKNAVDYCMVKYNYEHQTKITTEDTIIHLEHLCSLGLIERSDKEVVDNFQKRFGNVMPRHSTYKRNNFFQRTVTGEGFVTFIRKGVIEE